MDEYITKAMHDDNRLLRLTLQTQNETLIQFDNLCKNITNQKQQEYGSKEHNMFTISNSCTTTTKDNGSYEIRFRRFGYDKRFTSKVPEIAKDKANVFLKTLNNKNIRLQLTAPKKKTITSYAQDYFYKVKKTTLKESTFAVLEKKLKKHLFNSKHLSCKTFESLKVVDLEQYLNDLGKYIPRTAEDVYYFLQEVYRHAFVDGLMKKNPFDILKKPLHIRKQGQALTLEEEDALLTYFKEPWIRTVFKAYLYTGARPVELKSIRFDLNKGSLTLTNAKLKQWQTVKTRTLPIFPKMKQDIEEFIKIDYTQIDVKNLSDKIAKAFPGHSLKSFRHTFATRCKQCGCNPEIVSKWMNHTLTGNTTTKVYTHYTFEDEVKESNKVIY